MDLTKSFPTILTALAAVRQRATDTRRILSPAISDDMQVMHLAESHLISTPPQFMPVQRKSQR